MLEGVIKNVKPLSILERRFSFRCYDNAIVCDLKRQLEEVAMEKYHRYKLFYQDYSVGSHSAKAASVSPANVI